MKTRLLRRLNLSPDSWSLASLLALAMLCVAAIAITILFFDSNRSNSTEMEALQRASLNNSAHDLTNKLDALIQNEHSRIENLALSRAARQFVAVQPDQRAALFTPTLDDFVNFIDSNKPYYQAVLLLDQDGEVLISTDGSYVGLRFPDARFFQDAMDGRIYMSDPGISPLDRQPVIWLSAPVYAQNRDTNPAGVVTIALNPEEIWTAVEQVRIGTQGYALLLDQYGIRLAHGHDRRYIFRSLTALAPETWQGLRDEGRFLDLAGIQHTNNQELFKYISSKPLAPFLITAPGDQVGRVYYSAVHLQTRPDWTVVAMLSEREVLASAARVTLRSIMATILVVIVLGLTVAWLTRWLVRPVPRLAQAAERIAAGDLSTTIEAHGSSEVHALAETFEMMRQRLALAHQELADWAQNLERRVALRSQELASLSEVVALSSHSQSQTLLLKTALERALGVMEAEMGGIWLAENALTLAVASGFGHALDQELTSLKPGEGLLGQVQTQGTPVALADISTSPYLAHAIVREEDLHSFAAVPLTVSAHTLGVLGVFSHSRQGFSAEAISVATSIGQQIALSLDNAILVQKLQEQARSVATLQEREHIAAEIHDGIAQNLSYIFLQLDQLIAEMSEHSPVSVQQRLTQLLEVLEGTTGEVRQFIARLQEIEPAPVSVTERLHHALTELGNEIDIDIHFSSIPTELLVPDAVSTELSRIMVEALRNAHKHGKAWHAYVKIERQNGQAQLSICDDGIGFDQFNLPNDHRQHFGLQVMRARAARIGGSLNIISQTGVGTCIEVYWPIV